MYGGACHGPWGFLGAIFNAAMNFNREPPQKAVGGHESPPKSYPPKRPPAKFTPVVPGLPPKSGAQRDWWPENGTAMSSGVSDSEPPIRAEVDSVSLGMAMCYSRLSIRQNLSGK